MRNTTFRIFNWTRAKPGERYSVGDVARGLGVCRTVIERWIALGILRAARPLCNGASWRIRRTAIRRALNDPRALQSLLRAKGR